MGAGSYVSIEGLVLNSRHADQSAGLSRTRLFHPWGREPEGAVLRLRCFRVARCQTWTILDSGQSPVMSHRDGF